MIKRRKNGPEFSLQPEDNWPVQKNIHGLPSRVTLEEAKKSSLDDEELAIISENTTTNLAVSGNVINMEKFNSFQRLCRVAAYVFRFIGNLKNSIMKMELILHPEVTINELNYSECLWLKFAQKELISNNSKYEKLRSTLKLYKDQYDLFRSKTRLAEANNLPEIVGFPIVLPSDSYINKILILDAHESVLHSRADSTLNRVRSRFWIIRGRQTVKKVTKSCVLCTWFQGHTLKPHPIQNTPSVLLELIMLALF